MGTYLASQYKTWTRARLQNITIDDTVLLQVCNDANREICNYSIPGMVWAFMQGNFAGTLTVGTLQYDFEDDWQAPQDMTIITPDNSASYPQYVDYLLFRQNYPDPTAGTQGLPTIWTTRGRTFLIGPTAPDDDYTLDMAYLKLPTTLTADANTIDVPDEWAELQVLGMLKRCLMLRRRYDQAQVIAQDWDLLMGQMIRAFATPQKGLPTKVATGWS